MTTAMSRTEELRRLSQSGRVKSLNNGDTAPFIVWPKDDEFTSVEGELMSVWTGKYGPVARIEVHKASDNTVAVIGSGDAQSRVSIEPGTEVNVGLNYAALEGIEEDQVGQIVHVAFTGWGETKKGDRFRQFDVFAFSDDADGPEAFEGPG